MKDKMTIILFSGEYDKGIAAFTLATTAAASDMDVTIFFTFWGLNFLKKSGVKGSKPKFFLQKLFGAINSGLPLSRFNFLGIGLWMMKKLMKKTKMASLEELMALAKQLNVKFVACTTSCGVMGLSNEELSEDVAEFAGAATYLAYARESKVNLFI
ncbi:MAG: DsrE/DsrF/DrsH-like family protein [bacterium]